MATLRLVNIDKCHIDVDKGVLIIKNLIFEFDHPKDAPELELDFLEAIDLAFQYLKTGKVKPTLIN